MSVVFFLDVSPLFEPEWTGIATLTKQLALEMIKGEIDVEFFRGNDLLDAKLVEMCLTSDGGELLCPLFESRQLVTESLGTGLSKQSGSTVGIFPNIKEVHRRFDFELLIVMDITYLLTPEFHAQSTIVNYSKSIVRDIQSSDLVCCISASTLTDLNSYLEVPLNKMFVSHPGVELRVNPKRPWSSQRQLVSVLGTVEPRKNLPALLSLLRDDPQILERADFVFIGRDGWGKSFSDLLASFGLGDSPSIFHPGFVSSDTRDVILASSDLVVFPSLYEGFGLPVLEAMAFSRPVLAAYVSSIPEIGLEDQWMFDPESSSDLHSKLLSMLYLNDETRRVIGQRNKDMSREFTWGRFLDRIVEKVTVLRETDN